MTNEKWEMGKTGEMRNDKWEVRNGKDDEMRNEEWERRKMMIMMRKTELWDEKNWWLRWKNGVWDEKKGIGSLEKG